MVVTGDHKQSDVAMGVMYIPKRPASTRMFGEITTDEVHTYYHSQIKKLTGRSTMPHLSIPRT